MLVYVALEDVLDHLEATAQAFDDAHALQDIGRCFRAYRSAIEKAPIKEFK